MELECARIKRDQKRFGILDPVAQLSQLPVTCNVHDFGLEL